MGYAPISHGDIRDIIITIIPNNQADQIKQLLMLFEEGIRNEYPNHGVAMQEIKDLIAANRKLEATKQYKIKYGVGLKEAKEAIDKLHIEIKKTSTLKPLYNN